MSDTRQHCTTVEGNANALMCNYCYLVIKGGGITRMKYHLSGTDPGKNVKRCDNCPQEVRDEMRRILAEKKRKNKKRSYRFMEDTIRSEMRMQLSPLDDDFEEDDDPEELLEMLKKLKRSRQEADLGGSGSQQDFGFTRQKRVPEMKKRLGQLVSKLFIHDQVPVDNGKSRQYQNTIVGAPEIASSPCVKVNKLGNLCNVLAQPDDQRPISVVVDPENAEEFGFGSRSSSDTAKKFAAPTSPKAHKKFKAPPPNPRASFRVEKRQLPNGDSSVAKKVNSDLPILEESVLKALPEHLSGPLQYLAEYVPEEVWKLNVDHRNDVASFRSVVEQSAWHFATLFRLLSKFSEDSVSASSMRAELEKSKSDLEAALAEIQRLKSSEERVRLHNEDLQRQVVSAVDDFKASEEFSGIRDELYSAGISFALEKLKEKNPLLDSSFFDSEQNEDQIGTTSTVKSEHEMAAEN